MQRQFASLASICILLGGFGASSAANAGVVQYSQLGSFQAASTTSSVDTFSNLAPQNGYTSIDGKTVNGVTYSGGYAFAIDSGFDPMSFDWGTGAVLELAATGTETITFASPITAFGALFGTVDPIAGSLAVTINGTREIIRTSNYPSLTFFGWISDEAFSSVTIEGFEAYPILDNLTLAEANVPEPSSILLGLFGLFGIALTRTRTFRP